MNKEICPFCGKKEYVIYAGDTVDVGFGDNYQVTPNEYECLYCGFEDIERYKWTEEQLIEKYKKTMKKRIKSSLKWCSYMIGKL